MTDLVMASAIMSCASPELMRAKLSRSPWDCRSNGVPPFDYGCRFAALLSINLIHDLPRSFRMFEKLLRMLSEKIPPCPDGGIGGKGHVTNYHQNTKDGLLECRYIAQIYGVQTCCCHGTCTEEDGVDIAKPKVGFGIAAVAINAATVHDDRGEDYGQEEINDVKTIEVHSEPAISAQISNDSIDATRDGHGGKDG